MHILFLHLHFILWTDLHNSCDFHILGIPQIGLCKVKVSKS